MSLLTSNATDSQTDVDADRTLGQYIPLIYHYHMLQDQDRVGAFRDAIDLIVQPDMHVVELGGGTGILSSFAARRGARVTCVERNPDLVDCARRFVAANGLDEQITVVRADAARFTPDTKVDAVVCEMLHVGLLREKQAQVIAAFKRNYVRRHGPQLPTFLPEATILMAQPVQQDFDFAGYVAPVPVFQAPVLEQPRTIPLAGLAPYANIGYAAAIPTRFDVRQSVTIECTGESNAIRFVTQNVIAIDVPGQRAITWPNQCLVLPLAEPVAVETGQSRTMKFRYEAGDEVEPLARSLELA